MREEWGFEWGLPPAASSYAGDIDFLLILLHATMVLLYIIGVALFVLFLVKYRARDGHRANYHNPGESASFLPAGLVLAFEIWLILAFEVPLWGAIKKSTPPPAESVNVHVIAQQFAWNFQYPGPDGQFGRRSAALVTAENAIGLDPEDPASADDVVTINNLHVPLGKPTILTMTSKDVIHDFQVTNLRNKQDVVPGMNNLLWFEPVLEGKFEIGCAQLCGLGHTKMIGNLFVESPSQYDEWLKQQAAEKTGTADARPVSSRDARS